MTADRLDPRVLNRATLERQLLLRRSADWKIAAGKDHAVLEIQPFVPLSRADRDAIAAEGERLLAFAAPGHDAPDVRFTHGA